MRTDHNRSVTHAVVSTALLLLCLNLAPPGVAAQATSTELAFTSDRDGDFDIYVMNDDGANVVQLTHEAAADTHPAWSPDGERIAFASDRDGDFEIFVMNADGTDVVQVTHTDASAQDRVPKWSPDGRFLVFQRPYEPTTGRHTDLYQVELATGAITRLTFVGPFGSGGGSPDWAPEARIIDQRHTDGDWELFVRDTNGAIRQLTFNNWDDHDPDWFPGGATAAFTSAMSDPGDIRAVVVATGTQTLLTSGPAWDGGASVSCDGSRIAFHRNRSLPGEGHEIWVMAADGTGQVNISRHAASDHSPDWRCTPPDATPPLLALPDTITVEATSASGAVVTFAVSATDDTDPNPTVSCTPPSGSTFPIGTNTVTCTATDASGNIATGSFTVIVQDITRPLIGSMVAPAPNAAGWHNSPPTITWSVEDPESGIATSTGCDTITVTVDTTAQILTCSATNGAGLTATESVVIGLDTVAPAITGSRVPAANASAWNNTDVTVSFACEDARSGVSTCTAPRIVTTEGAGQSITGTVQDAAGNEATFVVAGVNIDKTPPVIAIAEPVNGAALIVGQAATASYTCADATSGIAACTGPVGSGAPLDTDVAGARIFTVDAVDRAGNVAALTHAYSVGFAFEGFFAPLNNLPTTNRGPAGRTFPVKFALRDASGGFVGDPAAIASVGIVPAGCGTLAADVGGEEATADAGGLKYDPLTGVWHFNWQTTRAHGGCWLLEVRLADGSGHRVAFELR
jgi:hypothetical protein